MYDCSLEAPLPDIQPKLDSVRDQLILAVKRRLMTQVPWGVLLSGGLDSSVIAAIAVRLHAQQLAEREAKEGEEGGEILGMGLARKVSCELLLVGRPSMRERQKRNSRPPCAARERACLCCDRRHFDGKNSSSLLLVGSSRSIRFTPSRLDSKAHQIWLLRAKSLISWEQLITSTHSRSRRDLTRLKTSSTIWRRMT